MRELAGAAAGVLLAGVMTADAADMRVSTKASTAWNWTGLYIGANLGGVWGQSDIDPISSAPNALFAPFTIPPPPILIIVPGALGTMPGNTAHGTGFIGGMQFGYNWQINQILYGIEGDFDGSSLQSKATSMAISPVAVGAQALSAAYSAETAGSRPSAGVSDLSRGTHACSSTQPAASPSPRRTSLRPSRRHRPQA
jgi:opacity protein-like surface antigen